MPLRDHFRPPLSDQRSWEGFHGGWPMMIVAALGGRLPRRYVAEPQVHLGPSVEIDVATYEGGETVATAARVDDGGVATEVWAPPTPTLAVATDLPDLDEYEVRVYDTGRRRRLVAAVEIVSPANKDRPEHRRAFVARCAALLQDRVCVAVVDLVTTRTSNLYADLMDLFGQVDPSLAGGPPPLYAASCRLAREEDGWFLETWAHPLTPGRALPTRPLWLTGTSRCRSISSRATRRPAASSASRRPPTARGPTPRRVVPSPGVSRPPLTPSRPWDSRRTKTNGRR